MILRVSLMSINCIGKQMVITTCERETETETERQTDRDRERQRDPQCYVVILDLECIHMWQAVNHSMCVMQGKSVYEVLCPTLCMAVCTYLFVYYGCITWRCTFAYVCYSMLEQVY